MLMKSSLDRPESNEETASRERETERRRDEEDPSRMADEGCPSGDPHASSDETAR